MLSCEEESTDIDSIFRPMPRYYYSQTGEDLHGPVSLQEIERLIAQGKLPEDPSLRPMGSKDWRAYSAIVEQKKSSDDSTHAIECHRQTFLRKCAVVILILGLCCAGLILACGTHNSTSGSYGQSDNPEMPLDLTDSKRELRQVQMISGKEGVLSARFSEWLGEMGPPTALVIAFGSIGVAGVLWRISAKRAGCGESKG
jgi:hypothetical protein